MIGTPSPWTSQSSALLWGDKPPVVANDAHSRRPSSRGTISNIASTNPHIKRMLLKLLLLKRRWTCEPSGEQGRRSSKVRASQVQKHRLMIGTPSPYGDSLFKRESSFSASSLFKRENFSVTQLSCFSFNCFNNTFKRSPNIFIFEPYYTYAMLT